MIRCEFVDNSSKVIVKENEEIVLDLGILVNGDKVWVDVECISDSKSLDLVKNGNYMNSYFNFMNSVLQEVKKELQSNGIEVNKVLLGSISDVRKLDQFSCEIDEDYCEKEKTLNVSNMR